jgi:DNA-nicking Smr family endonuclease
MDFGDILDEWDKIKKESEVSSSSAKRKSRTSAFESWLDAEGVDDKDAGDPLDAAERRDESRRLASLRPQAILDLHGMTAEEAESAIAGFIDSSARSGLEKVLVIHGKGLHSEGGLSVLKKTARMALEAHRLAGRFGEAAKADGGSGALWVMIRKRRSEG